MLAEKLWNTGDSATFQPTFERLHILAYDQAVGVGSCTLASGNALQYWLLGLVRKSPKFALDVTAAFGDRTWSAFGDLVSAVGRNNLDKYRGNLTLTQRALLLNNQAVDLSSNGDHQAALAIAQEALGIYRRLDKANPAAYRPGLAMSLNNLANRMSGVAPSKQR